MIDTKGSGTVAGGGPRGGFPGGGAIRGGRMRGVSGRGRTAVVRTVKTSTVKPAAKKTTTRKPLVKSESIKTTSSGRKLYHGTKADLKPGTQLKSGKKFGASATTKQSVAKDYANSRLTIDKNAKPKVYEVKTRGKLTGPQGKGKPGVGKSNTGEVNSNKPFRVVREVKPAKKISTQVRRNARFK